MAFWQFLAREWREVGPFYADNEAEARWTAQRMSFQGILGPEDLSVTKVSDCPPLTWTARFAAHRYGVVEAVDEAAARIRAEIAKPLLYELIYVRQIPDKTAQQEEKGGESMVQIGDVVTYVDPAGRRHHALVTAVWGVVVKPPSINLVYVSPDPDAEDQYGRQLAERATSIVHRTAQPAPAFYWE